MKNVDKNVNKNTLIVGKKILEDFIKDGKEEGTIAGLAKETKLDKQEVKRQVCILFTEGYLDIHCLSQKGYRMETMTPELAQETLDGYNALLKAPEPEPEKETTPYAGNRRNKK